MVVRYTLKRDTLLRPPLTPEQIAEIEAHAPPDEDIVYDEDCPETTPEQLEDLREASRERDKLLVSLGLPLPSEDGDPGNRVEITEEQRRQIDAFWKERRARQRAEAIRKREAAEAVQKHETAKKRPVVNQSSLPLAHL